MPDSPKKKARKKKRKPKPKGPVIRPHGLAGRRVEIQTPMPTITLDYEDPETLVELGILLPVRLAVPQEHARKCEQQGIPVAEPVDGHMLVDTGATLSCISTRVMQHLELPQVGTTQMASSTDTEGREVPVHLVRCFVRDLLSSGKGVKYIAATEQGMPVLDNIESLRQSALIRDDRFGEQIALFGLLGRDFLSGCHMVYSGRDGTVSISVNPPETVKMKILDE